MFTNRSYLPGQIEVSETTGTMNFNFQIEQCQPVHRRQESIEDDREVSGYNSLGGQEH